MATAKAQNKAKASAIAMGQKLFNLDAGVMQQYQQNKPPWLCVDMITEVEPGNYARGYTSFVGDEWYFASHFPGDPNVPGTVLVEICLQVFIMTFLTMPEFKRLSTADSSIDHVRFRRRVLPGERLDVRADLASLKRGVARGGVLGSVGDEPAIEFELTVVMPDVLARYRPRI